MHWSVVILLINQSAMDFFTCVSTVVTFTVMLTHGFVNHGNPAVHYILCFAVGSAGLVVLGVTVEKLGLVVITLERYFKVVHAEL